MKNSKFINFEEYNVPGAALDIIDRLCEAGYEAFFVGGCVRDLLLGKKPDDYDIATNSTPDETEKLFDRLSTEMTTREVKSCGEFDKVLYRGTVATGKKHGTIGIIADESIFEVTTYRIDGEYSDNRRPDEVSFTPSLEEDMKRRDFTINALALDRFGGIRDCVGGLDDLKHGVIRAVGSSDKRFCEDALRMLRGIRFEAALSAVGACDESGNARNTGPAYANEAEQRISKKPFIMETDTEKAIHDYRFLLTKIAKERIRVELSKTLMSPGAAAALRKFRDVFAVIIPELEEGFDFDQMNPFHCYDVYEHSVHAVEEAGKRGESLKVLLAALLHDIGKPSCFVVSDGRGHFYGHESVGAEMAEAILKRLRFDSETVSDVTEIIKSHGLVFNLDERYARRKLSRLGEDRLKMLIALERVDVLSQAPDIKEERVERINEFERIVEQVLEDQACFCRKDLAVNGKDLLEAGIKMGPEVGRIIELLLDKVLEDELPNDRQALLNEVQKIKDN